MMAAYMEESDFHPKNTKKKGKRHRVTAPQYGIVNIDGLRDDYPHVSRDQSPPPWWSIDLENMYRCQMAGYRDEKHYLQKRRLKGVQKWPENGLIKKLVRWDGLYYYFSKNKECPNLQKDEMKRAFLREPIIFENTAYLDKKLVWAPIITEQAKRFNEACDELIHTIRKPKKTRKGKNEAGPSRTNRAQEEKSVTFLNKDKYLLPEDSVVPEKKKSKEKNVDKPKKSKENRRKSAKNKSSTSQHANGDGNPSKNETPKKGKENITENVEALIQNKVEDTKLSDKREIHSAKLPTIKEDHMKNRGKSLSASDFSRSESQIGKEGKKRLRKKKSSIKPSTSAVLKTKKDPQSTAIPVTARVAAKKSTTSEKGLQKVLS